MIIFSSSFIPPLPNSRKERKKVSEVTQSCPTLCDPIYCSLLGSIHGIFQARVLEWGAIAFSRGSSRPRDWTDLGFSVLWFRFLKFQGPVSSLSALGQPGREINKDSLGEYGFPGNTDWWWRICLQCRRLRFDPWVGKIPGEGHGNPLQCSCLENPTDRGAWWATVHGSQRVRHDWATHTHTHTHTHRGHLQFPHYHK